MKISGFNKTLADQSSWQLIKEELTTRKPILKKVLDTNHVQTSSRGQHLLQSFPTAGRQEGAYL